MKLNEAIEAMKKEGILPEKADHLDLLDRLEDEAKGRIPIKPAIKDPKTGQVHVGKTGEDHGDVGKAAGGELKTASDDFEGRYKDPRFGFVEYSGDFISRDQAKKRYGVDTSEELPGYEAKK